MRRVLWIYAGLSLLSAFGCAMCASPHDCKFAAYGGIRERTNHARGRVGSIFDPAPEINRVAPTRQPDPFQGQSLTPEARGEELPQIAPEESPSDIMQRPRNAQPPVDLPEGPEPSNGETLPEVPNGDSIELPELDDEASWRHVPVLQPGLTGVVPASFEEEVAESP